MPALKQGQLEHYSKLHFVGIGGSGMFPLVEILLTKGFSITGSDQLLSDNVEREIALGVNVHLGHRASNLEDCDALVYSAAVFPDNPELAEAKIRGIPIIERSELLGYLTRQYSNCICIAGTHGKTTTTAMITQILLEAGHDPTAVIGGKLDAINGSGRLGKTETMVAEACEFRDTFLHMAPDIAVVLNIDNDHMDYFKTMENMILSYRRFLASTSGHAVVCGDDENIKRAMLGLGNSFLTFGFSKHNDYYPTDIEWKSGVDCRFNLCFHGEIVANLRLHIPGHHNIGNAVAACAVCLTAGLKPQSLQRGLELFRGVHRRFEVLGTVNGITIADDYAHHPTEINAVLQSAKRLGFNSVWAVFQPFTYSRTAMLLDAFSEALSVADHVVLSDIMGAREVNSFNITSEALAKKIEGCQWLATFDEICKYIVSHAKPDDLVITLGCGDIYRCARQMVRNCQ